MTLDLGLLKKHLKWFAYKCNLTIKVGLSLENLLSLESKEVSRNAEF